jgi:hypothetical protein|tara:strand:- start:79 stop:513 length:435 start_codon:yes stop_codon:yes gene_type:complete
MPEVTVQDLIHLFEEAVRTDRRLPSAFRKERTTAWLDYRQEKMYQHSYHKADFKIVPTASQIDRWWIACEILGKLVKDIDTKRMLWMRAKKIPFTQLGRAFGVSRHKIKKTWEEELIYLRLYLQIHQKNEKISSIVDKICVRKG